MKMRSVIEIQAESYAEQQYIMTHLPEAVWIVLGEKTTFYMPYPQYEKVEGVIREWEKKNGNTC
jgi:hypothetical protein